MACATLLAACGMLATSGPTGVLEGQRAGGGPLLDCRGYFSQATQDIRFNVGMLQGPGVGFGFGSTPLLALDSITGDMIVHYQRYCQQYNVGLISRGELLRKTDMLHATQTVIRALVAGDGRPSSPASNPGLQAAVAGGPLMNSSAAGPESAQADLERMKLAGSIFKAILEGMGSAPVSRADAVVEYEKPSSPPAPVPAPKASSQTVVSVPVESATEPLFRNIVSELLHIAQTQGHLAVPIRVAVGEVHYRNTQFASPLSLFMKKGLRRELARSGELVLLEGPQFKSAGGITGLGRAPAELSAPEADVTIHGNYWEISDRVELLVTMRQRRGFVLGVSRGLFPSHALPRGVAAAPSNLEEAQLNELIEDRMVPLSAAQTAIPLQVEVWTDRGTGSVYSEGEEVHVMARVNKDAFLRLYYTDANNQVVQIFPNRYRADGWIRGGQVVTIPSSEDRFAFQVKPPFGVEAVTALASLKPFAASEENAVPAGPFFRVPSGVRGLAVVSSSAGKGEAVRSRAVLTTVPLNQ